MKYYTPKHFCVQEYIPKAIYEQEGESAIRFIDYRQLKSDDSIREFFGVPVIINTWFNVELVKKYTYRQYCGFRSANCLIGSEWSQHKFGRASDKIIVDININDVRKTIIDNANNFPYITVIEDKVSWLHTDCRCIVDNIIQLINP